VGLTRFFAEPIVREHVFKRIDGKVLVLGRQTTFFTPEQARKIIHQCGYTPNAAASANARYDAGTMLGGLSGNRADGRTIEDRNFFELLDIRDLHFLDQDGYEGADILCDINGPVPERYRDRYDCIIDGGIFDNIFNPAQAIINIHDMLRPGGRFITFHVVSYTYSPYVIVPYSWYLDFFALNGYRDCRLYNSVFFENGTVAAYTPNLRYIAQQRSAPVFGLSGEYLHLIYVIAEKGNDDAPAQMPSQDVYRSQQQWNRLCAALEAMVRSSRPDHVHSVGSPPVRPYYLDEFMFVDGTGQRIAPSTCITRSAAGADVGHMAKRFLALYNSDQGELALLGRLTDFNELIEVDLIRSIVGAERVHFLSMYDATREGIGRKPILRVSTDVIRGKLLVNCAHEHKDRLHLFALANQLGARGAVDLLADEERADEYWACGLNLPSSIGRGRTYIKGLP
jgi:hypothetical protein